MPAVYRKLHAYEKLVTIVCPVFRTMTPARAAADLVIAQAGHLSVVSLCSSRHLRLNSSSLCDVSAMAYDSATGRLLLSGAEADRAPRLWSLQMSDGARPQPVHFSGERNDRAW